jgi:O-antigen/teichoic acid export membrane protein
MLKYSLPLIPAGVAIWGVNGLNRLFMLHYLTLDQIGLYSVGAKFVVIITLSVIAFQLAWPHFSLSNMNSSEAAATFASIFNIVAAIGLWMVIGITFFADTLIKFALSSGYAPAAAAVLPLSLGMFIYGLFYFFSTGPVFSKTTSMIIPPIAVAIAANVVLNIFLTPRFGFTGTAWVTTITYLIMTLGMIFTSRKCAYIAIEWGKIARLAAIAVPLVVFSAWTERMNGTYMLAIKIVLFLLFPLVLIFTGFIKWPAPDRTRLETAGNGKDFISEKRPCVELPVE